MGILLDTMPYTGGIIVDRFVDYPVGRICIGGILCDDLFDKAPDYCYVY